MTQAKRKRERAKQEKRKAKAERRALRKEQKALRAEQLQDSGEDPDLMGILAGPQRPRIGRLPRGRRDAPPQPSSTPIILRLALRVA